MHHVRQHTAAKATGVVLAAICCTVFGATCARAEPLTPRPDLLLITLDTTRPDHLQPYGAADIETPSLASIAADGVVFEKAYSVAPITLVAHASILTGLDPTHHGVHDNGTYHLADRFSTLAELLRAQGYRTGAFVAASVLEKSFHLDQGFDVYDDDLSAGLVRQPHIVADRPADSVVNAALAWLDKAPNDRPCFVWIHFYDPHAAYSPPGTFRERYRDRPYDGEIAFVDSQIGRLLAHPRASRAAWAVIGDHGESLGEHGEQTHGLLAYDATLHVPWLMRFPIGPRRARVRTPVSQVDVVPTILGYLGVDVPAGLDGIDLMPLLRGQATVPERDLYAETFLPYHTYGWAPLRSLRRGAFQWIEAPTPELYDTDRDPRQLVDLAAVRPDVAADLAAAFAAHVRDAVEEESPAALDEDTLARLQSLGYLTAGSNARRESSPRVRPYPKDFIGVHTSMERSRALQDEGLLTEARAELESVLQRDPTNIAALVDLASLQAHGGELDRAIGTLEKALREDPDSARLQLILSGFEERRSGPERALALCESALARDPRSLEGLARRARLLVRLGREEEARRASESALRDFPDAAALNLQHAQLFEARDQPERALQRIRRALERDPHLTTGWTALGELLEARGDREKAAEAYRDGLRRAPDDTEAHAHLGLLLARMGGDSNAAIGHLSEAIRLSDAPRHDLRVALGALYAEQGQAERAEAEYAKVLAAEPTHPGALNNRAIALYRSGRVEEAEAALRALIARNPGHADALNNLAAMELDSGNDAEAEALARRAIQAAPDAAEAWNNLGLATEARDVAEARRSFERAIELQPTYWQARMHLGMLLQKIGDAAGAAKELAKVVELSPTDAETHLALGRLYAGSLGQPAKAIEHLNTFLRLAPQHPEATAVRGEVGELRP